MNSKKFVVYTALFGRYDTLTEVEEKNSSIEYICFTDNHDLISNTWKIVKIDILPEYSSSKMNRRIKILHHLYLFEYQYSLYLDANITIKRDVLTLFLDYAHKDSFYVPIHPKRNCVYKEAIACVAWGKCKLKDARAYTKKLRSKKFPRNNGLGENNIIIRDVHSEALAIIMNDWWIEYNEMNRDQLSLGYVLWNRGKSILFLHEGSRDEHIFSIKNHDSISDRKVHEKISGYIQRKIKYIFVPFLLS